MDTMAGWDATMTHDHTTRVAASLWRNETLEGAMPKSTIEARTCDALLEQCPVVIEKWTRLARVAIAAQWVKPEDALPGDYVTWCNLVIKNDYPKFRRDIGYWSPCEQRWRAKTGAYEIAPGEVTHWMPIPEVP